MPNRNYQAGRDLEWAVAKQRRTLYGADTARSAGSHGKWDLTVVWPLGTVELIQCKLVATQAEADRLKKRWKEEPPLGHRKEARYHQVLVVKMKGKSEWEEVCV